MTTESHTVAAHDLQPGDDLVHCAIGGHAGRITSVQVAPSRVYVVFETPGRSAYLGFWEVCTIRRERRA